MDKIKDPLEEVKNEGITHCVICEDPCNYGVCVRCDSIITARKVYKRFYQDTQGLDKMQNAQAREEKEKGTLNRWKDYYCFVVGLDKEEIQIFWNNFNHEINRLGDSFFYMCNVLHFNSNKGIFKSGNEDFFGDLARFNKKREVIT